MTGRYAIRIVWGTTIAVFLAGVILGVVAIRRIRVASGRIASLQNSCRELSDLHEEMALSRSCLRTYEDAESREPVDVPARVKKAFPFGRGDVRTTETHVLAGWSVRLSDVSLTNVDLKQVGAFVHELEAMQPPVWLSKITIRASSSPGRGDVALAMRQVIPDNE